MFNTLGNILKITSFGESHGEAIGGILDGVPAGIKLNFNEIYFQLKRRKPGQSAVTTSRNESDEVKFLSGIKEGMTTGHSIGFLIPNLDFKSEDYSHLETVFRPSHADFTYMEKYGIRDARGGGRSSARETANWVVAGTIAKQIIPQIEIYAFVSSIGSIDYQYDALKTDLTKIENSLVRCPDELISQEMIAFVQKTKNEGDSLGGTITCIVKNMPVGIGEPIFHKLEAELARAMLTINACKGFEIGSGFEGTKMKGSEHNDEWLENRKTKSNHSGGIQGGISNGMDINFKLAFKPTATILKSQNSIDTNYNKVELEGKGRHDPCVVPRAVPIVDALTSFVLADMYLLSKIRRID